MPNFTTIPNLISIPNFVTLSRLLAVPVIFLVLIPEVDERGRQFVTIIFLIAALTDWLDGFLARRLNQISEFGKFLDPLVDKLLLMAALLALLQLRQVPVAAVFAIMAREFLITAWRGAPDGQKTGIVGANIWGKAKTVSQILAITALFLEIPNALILFWISVVLTLVSGVIYLLPPIAPSSK